MERHLNFVKLDVTSPHCKICGGDFVILKELIEHLHYNHGKKITEDMLKEVMPFKFDGEEMSCYICSTVAYSFAGLVKHMVVHYNKYYCKECDLNFNGSYALKQHEIMQHSISTVTVMIPKRKRRKVDKIECVYCGIELKSRGALRTHLAKDHNVKQVIPCKACEKTFPSEHTLNMHIRNFHLMERNFKCTECDNSFPDKSSLNKHKRKHAKAFRYQCDMCQKW